MARRQCGTTVSTALETCPFGFLGLVSSPSISVSNLFRCVMPSDHKQFGPCLNPPRESFRPQQCQQVVSSISITDRAFHAAFAVPCHQRGPFGAHWCQQGSSTQNQEEGRFREFVRNPFSDRPRANQTQAPSEAGLSSQRHKDGELARHADHALRNAPVHA